VLTYTLEGRSRQEDGEEKKDSSGTWRVTVVGRNPDGSSRVLIRQAVKQDNHETKAVGGFDVTPQGKATSISGFNPRISTEGVLPLLPADAREAATQWKTDVEWNGSVTTFTPETGRAAQPGLFVFTGVQDSAVNKIYVSTHQTMFYLDREKGVLAKTESQYSQGYGFNQTGMATFRLEKDETIEPARAEELGKEYVVLFDAERKSSELLGRISEEPENAGKLFTEATSVVADAAKRVKEPEVVKQFEDKTKAQEQYRQYMLDDAKRLAGILNKPAADWAAVDLDGKPWSMQALRGKVVVMDFWYRGCGWCMFAMPQVKQLAADYRDKGVVVLGMNTDRNLDDARFVVKTLGLDYPQVRAEGLPEKFGVHGFPSLIVIDQAGIVRTFHSGYSKDLRESIGKKIDALLAKAPA
jgi:thiol-disulfide isomerase/thioredoxin